MLINSISRQCVLKLKKRSDKRSNRFRSDRGDTTEGGNSNNNRNPDRTISNNHSTTNTFSRINEDRSLLGCLLACKPCQEIIDDNKKNVVHSYFSDVNY